MIRLFTALCKAMLNSMTDEALFQEATNEFNHYGESCPNCGARGKLTPYGDYSRWLVFMADSHISSERVRPLRFECLSCGATHALLPDVIVPYSPYSLRFKLTVLIAYLERETTVTTVAERFGIAVSTIYAWKHLLVSHKELLLGVLLNKTTPILGFLHGLFKCAGLSEKLCRFFGRHGFSFLQGQYVSAARAAPP